MSRKGVAWSRMPESRDPMDQKEVQRMMKKAEEEAPKPSRDKALIAILYLTGARISEVLELKREHVLLGMDKV